MLHIVTFSHLSAAARRLSLISLLLACLLIQPGHPSQLFAATLTVGPGASHATIREALAQAAPQDIILVQPGIYRESLLIDKPGIQLIGAGFSRSRIEVEEGFGVKISGVRDFRLEGLGIRVATQRGFSAILINGGSGEISHCLVQVQGEGYGIFCTGGAQVVIRRNTIVGCRRGGGVVATPGVHLEVMGNILAQNVVGVNFLGSGGCPVRLEGNLFWQNGRDYNACPGSGSDLHQAPGFVASAAGDFRLREDAVAWKLGIGAEAVRELPAAEIELPAPRRVGEGALPALWVEYELLDAGRDGVLHAPEEATLRFRISNRGHGTARDVWLKLGSSTAAIQPFMRELGDIAYQETKETQYTFYVPYDAPTEEARLTLKVTAKGYTGQEQVISIPIEGQPTTGGVVLESEPSGAKVLLSGKAVGTTPLELKELAPGEYLFDLVTATHRGQAKVSVQAGQVQRVKVQLSKLRASLRVVSRPAGAKVFLGEEFRGYTPLELEDLPVGSFRLRLSLVDSAGRRSALRQVVLQPGRNEVVVEDFALEAPPEGMVYVPAGKFLMGDGKGKKDERPVHEVYLSGYFIDRTEVTNRAYLAFCEATGRKPPAYAGDRRVNQAVQPVVGVSWYDAEAYCKWLGKRLPTEAEWEKAARGEELRRYPWGEEFAPGLANAILGDGFRFSAPVGSFPGGASPYGVLDMAGNVYEWCADWYGPKYYAKSPKENPRGPRKGKFKVLRGGSWEHPRFELRTAHRWRLPPDQYRPYVGFRCAWGERQ